MAAFAAAATLSKERKVEAVAKSNASLPAEMAIVARSYVKTAVAPAVVAR